MHYTIKTGITQLIEDTLSLTCFEPVTCLFYLTAPNYYTRRKKKRVNISYINLLSTWFFYISSTFLPTSCFPKLQSQIL